MHASWEHRLLRAERLARVVKEFKPIAYLHGHKHQRWLLRPLDAENTLCVNCGAAGMTSPETEKQAGFVTFEIEDDCVSGVVAHFLDRETEEFGMKAMQVPQ